MAYTSINSPTDYFNTVLYSGNGSTQTISGVGFEPDFTWIKTRSATDNHSLQDQVRGANKHLRSDSNIAETESGTVHISSWNSDGFALGSLDGQTNAAGRTYVAWNWLAGNSTSSNTDGDITSTVSVNTTAGFSIVSYTGNGTYPSTIGHGLGSVPQVLLTKKRNGTLSWQVYHIGTGNTKKLQLNGTNAESSDTVWNNTTPTSSVFTVGNSDTNNSGDTFIAYCFAEKKGFSKFGSYTGNGSTDGPMVYTGFKPAWVLQKNISVTQGWQLQDNKRLGYNPDNYLLQPHTDQSESALQRVDLLSNGFKVRTTDAGQNASGNTYIYMAFAESPFTTSTGVPTTAR